ncbi:restriction endonuclease subunit S [Clostridium sporogenes]
MKSNYKRIGDYIREVKIRNKDLSVNNLMGINIDKYFMPSVANTIGTDMSKYKIVKKGQFACNRMHVGRDKRLPIALHTENESIIVSPAYTVFEIIDESLLNIEYLMMWFSRKEFDREAWFYTDSDVRGGLSLSDFLDIKIPILSIEKQREIVKEYNTILNRIKLNENMIEKLEDLVQSIYKQWFVDFEIHCINNKYLNYNSNENIPESWEVKKLADVSKMKYGKTIKAEEFLEEGYPIFSGYGIRGYCNKYMYENSEIIVIARGVSGTGRVVMSPPKSFITNLSIVVQGIENKIDKNYLYYTLKNKNLRLIDSGSAQSQITTSDLEKVEILVPPIEIQSGFSNIIDKIIKKIVIKKHESEILKELNIILNSKISYIED